MTDIRDQLNRRRDQLLLNADLYYNQLDTAEPGSKHFESARAAITELRNIESVIAQMQGTDATLRLADAQRDAAAAQRDANNAAEQSRARNDERFFWLRRFITSVAVAHGAGAFAAVTALTRSDPPVATEGEVGIVLSSFLVGLVIMGSLPLVLAFRHGADGVRSRMTHVATAATIVGTSLLLLGVCLVVKIAVATFGERTQPDSPTVELTLTAPKI